MRRRRIPVGQGRTLNNARSSAHARDLIAREHKVLGELTGLSDTELVWIDNHFLNHPLHSNDPRMLTDCERAETAYRAGRFLPLMSHLARLQDPARSARDDKYRTQFYEPAKAILEKLRAKAPKE